MQVIVAPDKFKGSLTSFGVCDAVRAAFSQAGNAATIFSYPMADGGDGFAAIMKHYLQTGTVHCETSDPLGRPIPAGYEWNAEDKIAIIEMAVASGLELLKDAERNPLHTTTSGTGLLIKHAIDDGAKKIVLGLGGSATNDAGMGILDALGFIFENGSGQRLSPSGENLIHVKKIRRPAKLADIPFEISCDVQNTLYGKAGAAYIYAPQKGATPSQVEMLDRGLRNFAKVLYETTGRMVADIPGTGAAGGIAAGLMSFFDVKLMKGIEMIIEASGLKEKIASADLIITGEGRLDSQSSEGKVVGAIASLARKNRIPCIAVCGSSQIDVNLAARLGLKTIISLKDDTRSVEESMTRAAELLVEKLSSWLKKQ
jgi:glycerate kinase